MRSYTMIDKNQRFKPIPMEDVPVEVRSILEDHYASEIPCFTHARGQRTYIRDTETNTGSEYIMMGRTNLNGLNSDKRHQLKARFYVAQLPAAWIAELKRIEEREQRTKEQYKMEDLLHKSKWDDIGSIGLGA